MKKKSNTIIKKLLFYVFVIITCVILTFPFYWLVITSLTKKGNMLNASGVFPHLSTLTIDTYINIFTQRPLSVWFRNSLIITFGTIIAVLLISTFAAYSLSRFRSSVNKKIGYSLLLVCMMPSALFIIPLYITLSKMGLINDSLSVIIANSAITIPFSTWMMKSFFDGISINLEEAAQIDGCGVVSSIFRVVLPLSLPGLAATIIYTAVLSWSDFLFSRTFLNTEPKWTITVGVYSMIGEHGILWEEISAAAVISIMPITLLFIFMQKYLITGMTSGAVKQ